MISTHWDADHTGLVGALHAAGARVLVHGVDEPTLSKPRPKSGDARPINMVPHMWRPTFWKLAGAMISNGRPAREVRGRGDFREWSPGRAWSPRVVPTPGHTPGHCAFHFEGHGAVFVGDALCTKNPLTGETGAQLMSHGFNVSDADAHASLGAIESIDAELVFPGHGEPWRDGAASAVAQARSRA